MKIFQEALNSAASSDLLPATISLKSLYFMIIKIMVPSDPEGGPIVGKLDN